MVRPPLEELFKVGVGLDQSFIAPFSPALFQEEGYDPNRDEKIEFWRSYMDRLAVGKISWEKFLQGISISEHPARFLSTKKTGESLLHLAVLSNRADLVEEMIALLPQLKWRQNSMGWTPLELSRFLPRSEIARLLEPFPPSFADQPNVAIYDRERFDALLPVEFIPQPLFQSEEIFNDVVHLAKKAKQGDEIPLEGVWMGIYFDKEIQSGTHPKVSIRFVDEKMGFGVFAEQRIPSCAFAGEYLGIVRERKKSELKDKVHAVRYAVWDAGKRKFTLDGEKMGNFTRFINHSGKPNLSLQSVYWRGVPRMVFVALKEISQGTQLTFDYGSFFWKELRETPVVFE